MVLKFPVRACWTSDNGSEHCNRAVTSLSQSADCHSVVAIVDWLPGLATLAKSQRSHPTNRCMISTIPTCVPRTLDAYCSRSYLAKFGLACVVVKPRPRHPSNATSGKPAQKGGKEGPWKVPSKDDLTTCMPNLRVSRCWRAGSGSARYRLWLGWDAWA